LWQQWRRSPTSGQSATARSVQGACVVRVALPDECRGSIRRVALPCRPGARARDLCRALAHAAAITNPQDYALFALHDGHGNALALPLLGFMFFLILLEELNGLAVSALGVRLRKLNHVGRSSDG
jgi:hypothetical protein